MEHDQERRLIKETDEEGNQTRYVYNELGALVKIINQLEGTTEYIYDELGAMIEVIDAEKRSTKYQYDINGRMTKRILPMGMEETFQYDSEGYQTSHTDFNGNTINYIYDQLGRITQKSFSDGTVEKYTYTKVGQLESIQDKRGTTSYIYDGLNRLEKQINPDGTYISYTYDISGNIKAIKTQNTTTSYAHDQLGRISTVTENNKIYQYKYNQVNNITEINYPNGNTTKYTYDNRHRITKIDHINKENQAIESYQYTYSKTGQVLQVTENTGTIIEYQYDKLYRLIEEKRTHLEEIRIIKYTYDSLGNRIAIIKDGVVKTIVYDANDRLVNDEEYTYSYDKNGNLLSKEGQGEKETYTYDLQDRLIKAVTPGEVELITTEYVYDATGIRVEKITNGRDKTKYIVDSNCMYPRVIEELDSTGIVLVNYTYGNKLLSQQRGEQSRYYQGDRLGSTRLLTDETGNITDRYSYDAFGNILSKEGTTENNYLFAGEQFDTETALYYLRARYMNPETGRFITMDKYAGTTYSPITQHKYMYANANPVNNTDPTGYFSLAELSTSAQIQSILGRAQCLVLTQAHTAMIGVRVGTITGMITERVSIMDDMLLGIDVDNAFQRVMLAGVTSGLMSGVMGFVGGTVFAGINAIPYIGAYASLATSIVMGGYGFVEGGEEIRNLVDEGKYLSAAVKMIDIIINIKDIVNNYKNRTRYNRSHTKPLFLDRRKRLGRSRRFTGRGQSSSTRRKNIRSRKHRKKSPRNTSKSIQPNSRRLSYVFYRGVWGLGS